MPAPAYVLGIDISRSGLGLAILCNDGTVPAHLRRAYGGLPGEPSDPQDWWRAARTGIKELLRRASLRPEQVRAIGITGEDALVALDRAGKALCPAVIGADARAESQVDELVRMVGARNLMNLASGQSSTRAMAVKLLWLQANEKRVWHDLAFALAAKDFLRFRLTETLVTDATDASSTLLFNPRTRAWSKQLLQLTGINGDWLPPVANGQALGGRVKDAAAKEAGLAPGTPVITGAGHSSAIAVAAGVLSAGSLAIELGGPGAFVLPTEEPLRDPSGRLITSCHTLANTWTLMADGVASAGAIDWVLDHMLAGEAAQARRAGRDPMEQLAELAAEVQPGSDGLMFLPPIGGGSTLAGLHPRHSRGHVVRAALEGGALAAKQLLGTLEGLKRRPTTVIATGQGSANHLWCQILSDVLDTPVSATGGPESAAHGVGILAATAVGMFKTVEEACRKLAKPKATYTPRRAAAEVYAALAPKADRLLSALAGSTTPPPAAAVAP